MTTGHTGTSSGLVLRCYFFIQPRKYGEQIYELLFFIEENLIDLRLSVDLVTLNREGKTVF